MIERLERASPFIGLALVAAVALWALLSLAPEPEPTIREDMEAIADALRAQDCVPGLWERADGSCGE